MISLFQSLYEKLKESVRDLIIPSWLSNTGQSSNNEPSTSQAGGRQANATVCYVHRSRY